METTDVRDMHLSLVRIEIERERDAIEVLASEMLAPYVMGAASVWGILASFESRCVEWHGFVVEVTAKRAWQRTKGYQERELLARPSRTSQR